jgi:hypothetical protein
VKYTVYHYHIEHKLGGKLACVLVACNADSPADTAQKVADSVLAAAYSRTDTPSAVKEQYDLGLIRVVPHPAADQMSLEIETDELAAMQFVGALTGEVLIVIEGDERKPLDLSGMFARQQKAALN